MARWRPAATASGRCVCGVAWIEFNASRPVSGCKSTRDAAEVMWDLAAYRRPPEIKAHPRWARQACRRHQRDRSRPRRAPNPGEIDEGLNSGGSWSTSHPPHAHRVARRPAPGGASQRPVWVSERPLPRRSSGPRPRQPGRDPPPSALTTKDSSPTATCRSRPLPPFLPEGVSRPCRLRLCYRRWRLDWARARRVP